MKDPVRWFNEAVNSEKYEKDVIREIESCISEDTFDIKKFMEWVSKQLEKDNAED